jgi:hypothetical protein
METTEWLPTNEPLPSARSPEFDSNKRLERRSQWSKQYRERDLTDDGMQIDRMFKERNGLSLKDERREPNSNGSAKAGPRAMTISVPGEGISSIKVTEAGTQTRPSVGDSPVRDIIAK